MRARLGFQESNQRAPERCSKDCDNQGYQHVKNDGHLDPGANPCGPQDAKEHLTIATNVEQSHPESQ